MAALYYTAADTSATWGYWCEGTTSTATTNTTSAVWGSWTTSNTTSMTTSSAVWVKWSGANSATVYTPARPRTLTAEELAKQDAETAARLEAYRIAEEKRKAEQEAANARAEELLRTHLSLRQRRQYRRARQFVVQAADGRRFRLKHGWAGNVEELDRGGRAVARLCIHPREPVPYADNLLAQKLLLETDPEAFRKIANRTEIARPARREAVGVN